MEPPRGYTLDVSGKRLPLTLGSPTSIQGTFKNPTVTLQAAATRHFSYGGLQFDYPATFSFEYEKEEGYRNWTIAGKSTKILYFVVANSFTSEAYAEEMQRQFGEAQTVLTPIRGNFGKKAVTGHRIQANVSGVEIIQDAYNIPAPQGESRLLVLQDCDPKRAESKEEPTQVLKLLTQTMQCD